jgi:hypothetical protein
MVSFSAVQAKDADMGAIFPKVEGWSVKGKINFYTPDNLYEYINGAADVFLSYDFVKLASLTLENKEKQTFTVDVYRHNNERNGFGIYCQEKPRTGPFMSIGAQGYYEKGILNFLRGGYYVKMSGFDLGDNDKDVLTGYAKKLAKKLAGATGFPAAVKSFPAEGKVADSEGYIAKNFLGHSFLHSAYVANYMVQGRDIQVFIMEGEDAKTVETILKSYLAFVEKKGLAVEKKNGIHRFQDPYYRSSGKMNMQLKGKYLWGLFSKSDQFAETFLSKIASNLKKHKLID